MDALRSRWRFRFAAAVEWCVAAAFLGATVLVGVVILQELETAYRGQPVAASPAPVSMPAVIPARAVSVPVLPLADGKELKVGDSLAAVAARLGRAAESGRQEVDRGSLGERLTRFYEYAGARFILVFEAIDRDGELKVAAIYLQ
jgi:hypothetical protein